MFRSLVLAALLFAASPASADDCPFGLCSVGSRPVATAARTTLVIATHPVASVRQFQPVRTILGVERRQDRRAMRLVFGR